MITAPRLEIDLDKIQHNARTLVDRLADRGISVTGVTKASLGSPEIAGALLRGGVRSLGDSRIENIEAIESKVKPSQPWGEIAQTAFGEQPTAADRGDISQVIFALGRQDTDPCGLDAPSGVDVLGARSDHLIADCGPDRISVGAEIEFQLNYSALVRAMTSPFVAKVVKVQSGRTHVHSSHANH